MRALILLALSVTLPDASATFPDLPGAPAEAINANCLACHSAEMVTTQPKLTKMQWQATITKMREHHRAPIEPQDDAAILAWLLAHQGD